MVKWCCSSALCFNNHRTKTKINGKPLKFYRLPSSKKTQILYQRLFRTTGMNFEHGHICGEHWMNGIRKNADSVPEIIVPVTQFTKLKDKLRNYKSRYESSKDESEKLKLQSKLNLFKKKYQAALSILNSNITPNKRPRRKLYKHSPVKKRKTTQNLVPKSSPALTSPTIIQASSSSTVLSSQPHPERDINELSDLVEQQKKELEKQKSKIKELEFQILKQQGIISYLEKNSFTYKNLAEKPKTFKLLCGLEVDEFNMLMECVRPYLSLFDKLRHPKIFGWETQYLATMTICRHSLNFDFMSFVIGTSATTMQRIGNNWIIFLATVFNRIELKPEHGFLIQKMPKSFIHTGHGNTDLIVDATEFKFQIATNYDVNSLMFSHYKNHSTGKALIGIAPHGMGIVFSHVYPGSISDSEITAITDILKFVETEHEIMTDRGFSIQDLCAEKGVTLNRPKQKEDDQFSNTENQRNFDIASTRIHVERFIGRVRKWKILNDIWPMNRVDILTCVWQMLCHTVNLSCPPIGPKE